MASRKSLARKELARRELARREAPAAPTEPESTIGQDIAESVAGFGLGGAQGLTLGFADEIAGGAGALKDVLSGDKGFQEAYTERVASARKVFAEAEAAAPGSFFAGDILGGLTSAFIPLGAAARVGKAATVAGGVAKRLAAGTAAGTAGGAIEGLGRAEGTAGEQLQAAGIGGLLGGAGGLLGGGLAEIAPKIVSTAGQLAKTGVKAKGVQAKKFGEAVGERLTRDFKRAEKLGIVQAEDFTSVGKNKLSAKRLARINERGAEVRQQSLDRLDQITADFIEDNPDRIFTAEDIGLDKLKKAISEKTRAQVSLDPSIAKVVGVIEDMDAAIAGGTADIRFMRTAKADLDDLLGDAFFESSALAQSKRQTVRSAQKQLREFMNDTMGDEFKELNLDLSSIKGVEKVVLPTEAAAFVAEGFAEGTGPIERVAGQAGGGVVSAGGKIAGGLERLGIRPAAGGLAPFVSPGVQAGIGAAEGAPQPPPPPLDPTRPEDRLLIKDRIQRRGAARELDSRQVAKKLDRLNRLQIADDEDVEMDPPAPPPPPENPGLLGGILGR